MQIIFKNLINQHLKNSFVTFFKNMSSSMTYEIVCIGGTFDRLHNGHKILLSEALSKTKKELIVGVTDESMIKNKTLYELIEPLEVRKNGVLEFLKQSSPDNKIKFNIVSLNDPFGPTIQDPNVDLIVVSDETMKGAIKINEIRKEKNWPELKIHSIKLSPELNKLSSIEEDKISSSTQRIRLLGQRLRPSNLPFSLPYIIGLTGGIASGKTTASIYLEQTKQLSIINCDKLGHETYKTGTTCFKKIVETFGQDILSQDGSIDRRLLGGKVFANPNNMKKLTDIVWPEIKLLAQEQIQNSVRMNKQIIILDAAVLLEAGWNQMCHEVWVFFIPKNEAIKRIKERDNLSDEEAEKRVISQLSNEERVSKANFVFCSLWEKEFTRKQVDKALESIQKYIDESKIKNHL